MIRTSGSSGYFAGFCRFVAVGLEVVVDIVGEDGGL